MAVNTVPVKTALGADELRGRSRTLGQRLRTVLLLVDGRRSLSEVLSLAQQAGAQPSHFDELVRAGMVMLPEVSQGPVAESSQATTQSPGVASVLSKWPSSVAQREPDPAPDSRSPRSVWPRFGRAAAKPTELPSVPSAGVFGEIGEIVPSRQPHEASLAAPLGPPIERPAPLQEVARREPTIAPVSPVGAGAKRASVPHLPSPAPAAATRSRTVADEALRIRPAAPPQAAPAPVALRAQLPASPASRGRREPGLTSVPSLRDEVRAQVVEVAAPPAPERDPVTAASEKLEHVRSLLYETLRLDSPVFGARMLLRLREATTRDDLIELVWSIERHLAATRHSRKEMLSLHRARELLGLGNTVVPEE